MVIGVDAGALCVTDERLKVGVYRVILRLLQELGRLDTKNQYRLYSFDPIDPELLKNLPESMYNMVLYPKNGWFQVRLPLSLFIHPIDLFLGVSQAIPWGMQKNIGFIYDVGFIHHPNAYPKSYQRLIDQTKKTAHKSKHIITISEASKRDIIEHYHVKPENITVAYPGVDERFTPSGETFTGNSPYFIHVGSLKPGKNIPTVIKAFAEFLEKTKREFLLLIVGGDYWMDEEILTTIEKYHVEESVRLLGYIPDPVLPQYYRGATAFVTASLSEGFCLPVLEAMASGCPVIASNAGAFPEVVAEESLLFPPTDIHAYASAMEQIVSDSSLREITIAKGIAKAGRYTWELFGTQVASVIAAQQ